jgi:hypothetical protein
MFIARALIYRFAPGPINLRTDPECSTELDAATPQRVAPLVQKLLKNLVYEIVPGQDPVGFLHCRVLLVACVLHQLDRSASERLSKKGSREASFKPLLVPQAIPSNQLIRHVVPCYYCDIFFGQRKINTYTSRKMDINTGSRGPFVPEIKPVQKIRDKSPPPPSLVPVPYKPVLKGPPRWLPEESRARDLWYRFVTRIGTKGIQGLGF